MPKRDFLYLGDCKPDEIYHLLARALDFKRQQRQNRPHRLLQGKTVALIFNKPSTRTRVSFETAISSLGADSIFLNANDLQLGRGETIEDTGKVLSRYVDALVIRTHDHAELETLAAVSSIPIINALSNKYHPCQALADLMTILEKKDRLSGIKLTYVGDGNNVCNSLIMAAAKVGIKLTIAAPKGYEPDAAVIEKAKAFRTGLNGIKVTGKIAQAVKGADVIYTDVWTSMGQEDEAKERRALFSDYQLNSKVLALAAPSAIVMHCLPAHRGEEISAKVIDGSQSVVFDQAENRLHAQKALLTKLLIDE